MNKKKIIAIVGLVLLLSSIFISKDKIVFQLELNKASYYSDNGNNQEALCLYNNLIKKEPKLFELYVNKGIILAEMENYKEALKTFKIAETINSDDYELCCNIAHLYNLMGKSKEEKDYIEKATFIKFSESDLGV